MVSFCSCFYKPECDLLSVCEDLGAELQLIDHS